MKTFLQIFFLVIVSFLNSKLQSQTNTILCQQWLLDVVHEFADNDIYNCTDKGSFSIREIEFEGVKYIQIYGYYGTFGVAYNWKGKIFSLSGDLLHAFDSNVNDGDCSPCNDIPFTQSTDLYNCDQTYPSCSDCSTEIEMVRLANNCGLAPKIVSTGEILRVCGIQAGLPTLPGEGRRAKIGYNLVTCGPSVCNFAEKQIEVICIDGYDDVQLDMPSKSVNFKDTFDIPFIVKNFKDVESFQFPVTWDTNKLKLIKVHNLNTKIANFNFSSNFNINPPGQLRCLYASSDGGLSINNDTLFYLQFIALTETCDMTTISIPQSIPNNNNSNFDIEITKIIDNISTTVNAKAKDSKIEFNKHLCNTCSTAIEMVQGTECILPQVISTGEILYPCAYTNGVSVLPSILGFKTNIDYDTYEGTGCTSFCQQGTAVSIGCVEITDTCGTHPDFVSLMALYNATNGPGWTNNTGWVDGAAGTNCDPCNGWYGVTCTNGRVTCLDLDGNPNCQGFCNSGNNLKGAIPFQIGDLSSLTNLHLGSNAGLTGSIPSSIGDLTSLTYLSINCTGISGSIPNELTNLTSLDVFWLHHNPNLTGPIPTDIGNMVELNEIVFNDCNLTGEIPASLGDLGGTPFYFLYLQNNNLSGCIPSSLQSLCPNVTTFGNISGNPLLSTQSWTNFCANQEGMCEPTNVKEEQSSIPFSVFPNPAYDRINISQSDKISQLEVMSIDGRSIFTEPFLGHEINVSSILPGVYILKLRDKDENTHILKFIKGNL